MPTHPDMYALPLAHIPLHGPAGQFSVTPTWADLLRNQRPRFRVHRLALLIALWFAVAPFSGDGPLLRPRRLHGPGAALHGRALAPLRAGSSLILNLCLLISSVPNSVVRYSSSPT